MAYSRLLMMVAAVLLSVSACSTGHYDDAIRGSYGTSFKNGLRAAEKRDFDRAASYFARAAESGHPRALISYGDALARGRGVERDPARALDILEEAYDKKSNFKNKAAMSLGRLLLEGGEGPSGTVEADPERARELLVEALEGGVVWSASTLGKIYEKGIGVDANVDKAISYYSRAASREASSARRLANLLVETEAPRDQVDAAVDKVVTQLERQGKKGDGMAWVKLAEVFSRGKIAAPDPEKTLGYLENVADDDDPAMLTRLARIYGDVGDSAQQNTLLRKAADLGDKKAQTQLAKRYLKAGTDYTNGPVGRYYAERAIAQGSKAAMVYLGFALVNGDVVEPDLEIGEALLRRAADAGHRGGLTALGVSLLRNQVTPRSPDEGQQLLEAAAEKGSAAAMSALGFAYYYGQGVTKDDIAALRWLQRAAAAGHQRAKRFLSEQSSGA